MTKKQLSARVSFWPFAASLLGLAWGVQTPALAQDGAYRLRAGDTVEVSVAGIADMRHQFTLDIDGQISLPLVGVVKAEGSTVAELRADLRRILPTKAFRTNGVDGQDIQRVIDPNDIAVNILDYAPIYINGDVEKPGELHFRPHMTVQQAVALAGGYEVMRYHLIDPVIESADLGAEYQTLWTDQAREQALLGRLKAQLHYETEIHNDGAATGTPVSGGLQSDLLGSEARQLVIWNSDFNKDKEFLTRAIKSATDQLATLNEQLTKEKEGAASDAAELNRLAAYNKQGDVTTNRVVDARRDMLLSSTRVLQTEEQIIQITREREDYLRQIDKLKDQNETTTLKDIEDSEVRLAAINARIAAAADKMVYTSTMRSQLPISKAGGPSLTITREGERGGRTKMDATEDTALEPGDVIDVFVIPQTKVSSSKTPD